jgi:hypothetical protein
MRKGLTITLLTVAIASMGYQAMSMAPVIGAIPDQIVGDQEHITATDPNVFVYPDAINLDAVATDDATPAGQIIWTYTKADGQQGRYMLNGVAALTGSENPNSTPAKSLRQVLQNEINTDGQTNTVTIRDNTLSDITQGGGLGPYPSPGAAGIVNPAGEAVTLIASDGVTYSTKTILIQSDNDGPDRAAGGGGGAPTPVIQVTFTTGINGWTSNLDFGSVTLQQNATNGLCMEVPAAGANIGTWFSDFSWMDLVANNVYRIRVSIVTTAQSNLTPLWDLTYENGSGTGTAGIPLLAYGGSQLYLDNVGGANAPAPLAGGRSTFDLYWAPAAVQTTAWNNTTTGPFAAANAATKDPRCIFRVLDVAGVGYGGENDAGQLCMKDITVVRWDVSSFVASGSPDLNVANSFTDAGATAGGPPGAWGLDAILNDTNITFASGVAQLRPKTAPGWTLELATFRPGDQENPVNTGGAELADNYPIAWDTNTLYRIGFSVAAPDATAEASPPDIIRLEADTPTQETIGVTYQTTRYAASGLPKSGTPQEFVYFFHANSETASTTENFNRLRPKLTLICLPTANGWGDTGATNNGGINISGVTVQRGNFPGQTD